MPVPLAAGIVAVLCAVATATQEFLLLVLAPVAVLALGRCAADRRGRLLVTVAARRARAGHTSVLRLRYGFLDNLTAYYSLLDLLTVAATTLMWGGVALLTLGLVWQLMGGALRDRRFLAVLASAALAAGLLSCAGIDHRRWWALATVGGLAALPPRSSSSPAGRCGCSRSTRCRSERAGRVGRRALATVQGCPCGNTPRSSPPTTRSRSGPA